MKNKKWDPIEDFVSEAEEILDDLDQHLIQIDDFRDKTQVRPELINGMFRGTHTLKGIAAVSGLSEISKLSHALEGMMDRVRLGRLTLTDPVVATLMQGMGALRQLVRGAQVRSDDKIDLESLYVKISGEITGKAHSFSEPQLEQGGIDPEITKVLTEYETHRLAENVRQGRHIVEIRTPYDLSDLDRDLSRTLKGLQQFGEVLATLPSPAPSLKNQIEFKIILGTEKKPEDLKALLPGHSASLREIGSRAGVCDPGPASAQSQAVPTVTVRSLAQNIRVDIVKLDHLLNLVGELVLSRSVIHQIAQTLIQTERASEIGTELVKVSHELDRRVTDLQEGLIEMRMVPVGQIFERLTLAVRKLAREMGKEVDLQITGEDTRLDKSVVEAIADPLLHLIRNALDHGIESGEERRAAGKPEVGNVQLGAFQRGNTVILEVADDGRGIDSGQVYETALKIGIADANRNYSEKEILNFLFLPGFSTANRVTEVSGRGFGLDVVSKNLARLNGLVDIETRVGKGTRFSITLPITLVITKALIVAVGSELYAVPLNTVSESLMIEEGEIRTVGRQEVIQLRGQTLSLVRLGPFFGISPAERREPRLYVIVVGLAEKRIGLVVDSIEGQQQIVIKSIGDALRNISGIAGATELGNRRTILVLDVEALIGEALGVGPKNRL